jgi:hypothetical protein
MKTIFNIYISSIIKAGGAKFVGIQKVKGKDKFALVTDPRTHSTYYLPIKGLTKKMVRTKLVNERKNSNINTVNL